MMQLLFVTLQVLTILQVNAMDSQMVRSESPPDRKQRHVRVAIDGPAKASLLQTFETLGRSAEDELLDKFTAYKKAFGRSYEDGSDEHRMRQDIFGKRLQWIKAHNTKNSWRAEINQFTDRTEDELVAFRGYKKPRTAKAASLLEAERKQDNALLHNDEKACSMHESACHEAKECCSGLVCSLEGKCQHYEQNLPESKDWSFLETAEDIIDQGSCGSCWAVASAGTIQLLAAKAGKRPPRISPQSILGCTPNPDECGGTGGCDGATAELAFTWAKTHGVRSTDHESYHASSNCPEIKGKPSAALIGGYVKLPVNKADPIINALYSVGPMTVAVAAGDWFAYQSGILNCDSDLTVDHAVVLMGYGKDKGKHYWKIRNSWGGSWGEKGFIRLARHPGNEPCGWDNDMQKGVGCKNDPKKAQVCGECGILSDAAYPIVVSNVTYPQNSPARASKSKWDQIKDRF